MQDIPIDLGNSSWIWAPRDNYRRYNDAVVFRKSFRFETGGRCLLQLAADSFYRLYCNGQWVQDGPSRSWDDELSCDVIDLGDYCRAGENTLLVLCRYFGCGTFRGIHRHAGMIAELRVEPRGDSGDSLNTSVLSSGESWQVADLDALIANTPKVSIQMEPCEVYDARLAFQWQDAGVPFVAASLVPEQHTRVRRGFFKRRTANLVRSSAYPVGVRSASLVADTGELFSISHVRLMFPDLIEEANGRVYCPFGLATIVRVKRATTLQLRPRGPDRARIQFSLGGRLIDIEGASVPVCAGDHLLIGFARSILNNDRQVAFSIDRNDDITLVNPLRSMPPTDGSDRQTTSVESIGARENSWLYLAFDEYSFIQDDLIWRPFAKELDGGKVAAFEAHTGHYLKDVADLKSLHEILGWRLREPDANHLFTVDPYCLFHNRLPHASGAAFVRDKGHTTIGNWQPVEILPADGMAVEIICDMGEQVCGYYHIQVQAPHDGVIIDVCSVEYIKETGEIQFADRNRNGMRFIAAQGNNDYTSLKRRSGRYAIITVRGHDAPVLLTDFHIIQTLPAIPCETRFDASDEHLPAIAQMCRHTLKLCMEDVFTDCPLYEQSLWVGDMRNEALVGYYAFGSTDIARNSLLLTAASVNRYELIAPQVPSCWKFQIPAFSFLWSIAVWEYYWYAADREFVRDIYPALRTNLQAALARIDSYGLFSGPYWNFLDWTNAEQDRRTVLYNSQLLIGALDAAIRCATLLERKNDIHFFLKHRSRLKEAILATWNADADSFPDSFDNGQSGDSCSQHTAFLALLFDLIPAGKEDRLKQIITNPERSFVQVGSPFAAMFMYEAMEKAGEQEWVIQDILRHYVPMLEAGATTAWESFPAGSLSTEAFPTRSHCHGWSSIPLYFFQRILLGLRQCEAGCGGFTLSPHTCGLFSAGGEVATPHGSIRVDWKRSGNTVTVNCNAPASIYITIVPAESLCYDWVLNGESVTDVCYADQ